MRARPWVRIFWIICFVLLGATDHTIGSESEAPPRNGFPNHNANHVLKFTLNRQSFRFDPGSESDLRALKVAVDAAIREEAEEEETEGARGRKDKKAKRALQEISRLAAAALACGNAQEKAEMI